MSDLTDAAEVALGQGLLNPATGVTPPAGGWWAGLHSADPTEAAVAELAGNGYARVQIPPASWTNSTGGLWTLNTDVVFPVASGSWGTIRGISLWTADTAGVAWWAKLLPPAQQIDVVPGGQFRIPLNNLRIRFL